MVDRPGITIPEIAAKYDRDRATVSRKWARHTLWPEPVGRRGRFLEYDAAAVDQVVRSHLVRDEIDVEPRRLYTTKEAAEALRVSYATVRSYISRDLFPTPDDVRDGVKLWRGSTLDQYNSGRRAHRART